MTTPSRLLKDEGYSVLSCIQCGTCTGSCPSGRYTSFNARKLVIDARRDHDVLHDETLWMCTTCYKCQERCPRGIRIVDAILTLRTEAVHKGVMLPEHRTVAAALIRSGHGVPINAEGKKRRMEMGLGELPGTVHKYKDALDEVQSLLKSTGFDRLIPDEEAE